jgi:hypothetical protein
LLYNPIPDFTIPPDPVKRLAGQHNKLDHCYACRLGIVYSNTECLFVSRRKNRIVLFGAEDPMISGRQAQQPSVPSAHFCEVKLIVG